MKIAIIPARQGSKRIKKIQNILGKPILSYDKKNLLQNFDYVIVSTDLQQKKFQ